MKSFGCLSRSFRYSTKESGSSDIYTHYICFRTISMNGIRACFTVLPNRKFYEM